MKLQTNDKTTFTKKQNSQRPILLNGRRLTWCELSDLYTRRQAALQAAS